MKKDILLKGWRIAVEILFAAFEQKDCNGEPQQMLIKVPLLTAPNNKTPLLNFLLPGSFLINYFTEHKSLHSYRWMCRWHGLPGHCKARLPWAQYLRAWLVH